MRTLPATCYADPATWAEERAALFGAVWQVLTHAARVAQPGSALAVEAAGGWPLLLVRGEDGVLRGFHNVCRHRAGPLLWAGETRRCEALRCRYHAWTYALDGRLLRAPGFGAAPEADGLFPVAVAEAGGLVFGCLAPEPPPLAPVLEALAAEGVALSDYRFDRVVTHKLACDWKTYVENYLEGYHISAVHPALAEEVDVARYAVRVARPLVVHEVPSRDPASPTQGWWAWLWPNLALNLYRGGLNLERVLPQGPGRCNIEYTYLFREDIREEDRARAIASSELLTVEDRQIVEAVQRNLEAGVYRDGVLSPRHEQGLAAFHEWWREMGVSVIN